MPIILSYSENYQLFRESPAIPRTPNDLENLQLFPEFLIIPWIPDGSQKPLPLHLPLGLLLSVSLGCAHGFGRIHYGGRRVAANPQSAGSLQVHYLLSKIVKKKWNRFVMITIKSSRSLNLFQLKKKSRKKRSESLKIPSKVYQKSIETLFVQEFLLVNIHIVWHVFIILS